MGLGEGLCVCVGGGGEQMSKKYSCSAGWQNLASNAG